MAQTKVSKNEITTQEAWIAPTLQNSWVNYGSGFDAVGYMKDALGFVHIKGFVKSGTTTAATVLFTLPAGYRPGGNTYLTSGFGAGGTINAWELQTDGDVLVQLANATYSSLGHIVFLAEN